MIVDLIMHGIKLMICRFKLNEVYSLQFVGNLVETSFEIHSIRRRLNE